MMCSEIPIWFIALAVWGAVSAFGLVIALLLWWFSEIFLEGEEQEHVDSINRRIFG